MPSEPTAEERLVDGLLRSKYWKYTVAMLTDRRERLYHALPKTDAELWMKEGAVREINHLLRAPRLILTYLRDQRVPASPEPDADSDTSAPRSPSFVLPNDEI